MTSGCSGPDAPVAGGMLAQKAHDMAVPPDLARPSFARLSVDPSTSAITDPTRPAGQQTLPLNGWNWGQWGTVQPDDSIPPVGSGAKSPRIVRILLRWWGNYDKSPDIDAFSSDASVGYIDPSHLDQLVAWVQQAERNGYWVIVGIDSNCGQNSASTWSVNDPTAYCTPSTSNHFLGTGTNFTTNSKMLGAFRTAWKTLIGRLASEPRIAMWEPLPEPNLGCSPNDKGKSVCDWSSASSSAWNETNRVVALVYTTIRNSDAVTPVLIGASDTYSLAQITAAYQASYSGVIYTADLLNGAANSEYQANPTTLQPLLDLQSGNFTLPDGITKIKKRPQPVYVQQVGVDQSTYFTSKGKPVDGGTAYDVTSYLLDELAARGIGWTWWTYRESNDQTNDCSPPNEHFAPWCQHGDAGWQLDQPWLNEISSRF